MIIHNSRWFGWFGWFCPATAPSCCLCEGGSIEKSVDDKSQILQIYLNSKMIFLKTEPWCQCQLFGIVWFSYYFGCLSTYFHCRSRQWSELILVCRSIRFSHFRAFDVSGKNMKGWTMTLWSSGAACCGKKILYGSWGGCDALKHCLLLQWLGNTCRTGLASVPAAFLTAFTNVCKWGGFLGKRSEESEKAQEYNHTFQTLLHSHHGPC